MVVVRRSSRDGADRARSARGFGSVHGRLGPWQSAIGGRSCGVRSVARSTSPGAGCGAAERGGSGAPERALPDHYGEGEYVEALERRLAELFGRRPPSVAQRHDGATDRAAHSLRSARVSTVAFHPTCHLELHEHAGYAHLHGLKAELIGDRDRLIELDDLTELHAPIGALLLELPSGRSAAGFRSGRTCWPRPSGRAAGTSPPTWTAPESGRRRPTTSARTPRSAPISTASTSPCTRGSAAWRAACWPVRRTSLRRPASGAAGMAEPFRVCFRLPPPPSVGWMSWSRRCLGFWPTPARWPLPWTRYQESLVVPDPPQTPLFHLHLRGELEGALQERALDVAQERGVWLFHRLTPSVVSNVNTRRAQRGRARTGDLA